MGATMHSRVKAIIEETNYAFSYCRESLNLDYAEFAAMALPDFRAALNNPHLTGAQLMSILRDASTQHREASPQADWASFLARHVERSSNSNAPGGR